MGAKSMKASVGGSRALNLSEKNRQHRIIFLQVCETLSIFSAIFIRLIDHVIYRIINVQMNDTRIHHTARRSLSVRHDLSRVEYGAEKLFCPFILRIIE